MAYALVSAGAVATSTSGTAVTPAFGSTPVAGNLLILWVGAGSTSGTPAVPLVPSGWTSICGGNGVGGCAIRACYKIAAGADTAPTIEADAGVVRNTKLAEFSGNTATPADQFATGTAAASSPVTATAAGADVAAGELVIVCGGIGYTTAATKAALDHTLNNGAVVTQYDSKLVSTSSHYSFGWGITTGNAAADNDSLAVTTTKLAAAITGLGSFKAAAGAAATIPNLTMAPLSH